MDLAEIIIRWSSTKIAKRNFFRQKTWPPGGSAYRDNKDFKNHLWNLWSEFKIILKVEMITEWPSTKIAETNLIHDPSKTWQPADVASFPYVPISCERLRVILTLLLSKQSVDSQSSHWHGEWYRLGTYFCGFSLFDNNFLSEKQNVWNCLTISIALTTWEPFTLLIFSFFGYRAA